MDSLEVMLRHAFGAAFCIYGVKSLANGLRRRAWEAPSFLANAQTSAGLMLVLSGVGTALAPRNLAACYLAVPAIGLLILSAALERRGSETVDMVLLACAFLYLVTA